MDGAAHPAAVTRPTYLLVDGENIDATLGSSILGRRPHSSERPRWERLLHFVEQRWGRAPTGLFFLAANNELPMSFVQALTAIGYRPIPLRGEAHQKVVDIAILRTLEELTRREADVLLVSNDGDFLDAMAELLDDGSDRRVGVAGFTEFRNHGFTALIDRGLEAFDLEDDMDAFQTPLPRLRIISIDEFDPTRFL